jgi:hypothetical protein
MKSKLVVSLLVMATMLCPAFAFAAEQNSVVDDDTVAVAEDAKTGDMVGEAAEVDELYAPASAKEETGKVKEEAKEAVENVQKDEQ